LAVNIDMDLAPFGAIVPCGITGREVTTVQLELDRQNTTRESCTPAQQMQLRQEYSYALFEAFSEVFEIHLDVVEHSPLLDTDT